MYGSSLIPVDEDLKTINYTKCFTCLGFTSESNILEEYLVGKGTSIVVPQNGYEKSEKLFACLVDAMLKTKTCMIVRKIYRNGLSPKLYILLPKLVHGYPSLSCLELCFSENMLYFKFPSLKSKNYQPTAEQYDVVDKLIDSLNLMTAFEDDSGAHEAFALKKTLNPSVQYVYRCIVHRALHPNEPLAKPDDELLELLDIPKKLKSEAQPIFEQLKSAFPLEVVVKPKYNFKFQMDQTNQAAADMLTLRNDSCDDRKAVQVGTVTPMEDFLYLLDRGEKISDICDQLHNVICDLLFQSMTPQELKIKMALLMHREKAKEFGAHYYNVWIQEFKNLIIQKNKLKFWEDVIKHDKLGLISRDESESTTVTPEEAEKFYEIDMSIAQVTPPQDEDNDINELFDDM